MASSGRIAIFDNDLSETMFSKLGIISDHLVNTVPVFLKLANALPFSKNKLL